MSVTKKTPYIQFFLYVERRLGGCPLIFQKHSQKILTDPESALIFISEVIKATATFTVFREVFNARVLLPRETEDDALLRIQTYAQGTVRRLTSMGMHQGSGALDEALAAEKLRAWSNIVEMLERYKEGL